MSMTSWMEKIKPALQAEGFPDDPGEAPFIPVQSYCPTIPVFQSEFVRLLRGRKWEKRNISVFVDGVRKKSSEGGEGDLDGAFREILIGTGLAWEWIDLSRALGVPPGELHASHHHLDGLRPLLRKRSDDLIITLGSGSLTDLVKHALFLEGIASPFITVPTALTVTAFTSSFAVLDFHGAKRTLVSRPVTAAFWVAPFLESAPTRMSRAGYGDLLARFIAYGDWFLGYRLGVMDRYDEIPYRLMEPFVEGIRENATGFMTSPLPRETTACTAAALAMAGIAMSVTGETTPLSGFEHVISHGLDFLRLLSGRELVFHGEQVALGSVVSSRTIDRFLSEGVPGAGGWRHDPTDRCLAVIDGLIAVAPFGDGDGPLRNDGHLRERIEAARQEFHAEYAKKSARWLAAHERIASFTAAWPEIAEELARLTMRAPEMERLVRLAGLPLRPGETSPPTTDAELAWAVRFAPFVRSRMNIADIIFWMGREIPPVQP